MSASDYNQFLIDIASGRIVLDLPSHVIELLKSGDDDSLSVVSDWLLEHDVKHAHLFTVPSKERGNTEDWLRWRRSFASLALMLKIDMQSIEIQDNVILGGRQVFYACSNEVIELGRNTIALNAKGIVRPEVFARLASEGTWDRDCSFTCRRRIYSDLFMRLERANTTITNRFPESLLQFSVRLRRY